MFYLDKTLSVEKDDVLRGKIEVKRPREDVRSLRDEYIQTCVLVSQIFFRTDMTETKLNLKANDQSESSRRVKITLNGMAAQEYTME